MDFYGKLVGKYTMTTLTLWYPPENGRLSILNAGTILKRKGGSFKLLIDATLGAKWMGVGVPVSNPQGLNGAD